MYQPPPPWMMPYAFPAGARRQGAMMYNPMMYYPPRTMTTSAAGSASYGSYGSRGQAQYQTPAAKVMQVCVEDGYFVPTSFSIPAGATVRWVNYGRGSHTVTADEAEWDSGELGPGAAVSYTFGRPGVYTFHCRKHPIMRVTVAVLPTH